jgi:hypothetical protein
VVLRLAALPSELVRAPAGEGELMPHQYREAVMIVNDCGNV